MTDLTAFDIAALRFAIAGLVVLPFLRAWWPGRLPLKAKVVMILCGPGAVYSMLSYIALSDASAAYGGVFANGSLPLFTMLLAFLFLRERPTRRQILAVAIIIFGGLLLGYRGMTTGGRDVGIAIVLFLMASAILSLYIVGIRRWAVSPREALALINVPSAVIFLPLWFFFLPSGLAETDLAIIVGQALFQGLGPGFLAVILFALAAIHLGPTPTAGFSAAVPATAALLAIPVLGEIPNAMEWVGIATVTGGLFLLVLRR